jgi:tRNA dimethylallyltransferase
MTPGPSKKPSFLALVGPTASGKTSLSLLVAGHLDLEIISMDSRQVYRGMDVGTGKVSLRERDGIPHHGLDIRNPDERYSAGAFSRDCREWMEEIRGRNRVPLLVGGTGFFLRALTHPMFSEPELDQGRMEELRDFLNGQPLETLVRFLRELDPKREAGAKKGGRQRLTRALEIALLTGKPLSWWHKEGPPSEEPLEGLIFVLEYPREALYARIDARVEKMVRQEGLLQEVQALVAAGYGPEDPGMTGAGYREAMAQLDEALDLEDLIREIQQSHRRYARRQITWFRHQLPRGAVVLDATRPGEELAEEIVALWERRMGA